MMVLLALTACAAAATSVWPPPQSISTEGAPLALSPDFAIFSSHSSARLAAAIARHAVRIAPHPARAANAANAANAPQLRMLQIEIAPGATEHLGIETKYDYTLTVHSGSGSGSGNSSGDGSGDGAATAVATASTIYGAMYALETFAQLVDTERGELAASSVRIADHPDHPWRGLLLDAGRRFAPLPLLENLIDTMAAVKLNVLHLHVTDFCRFGVESLLFPKLTAAIADGPDAGFYSQEDVRALIAYGGDRGVRIVPEFEMPGHGA